MLEVDRCVLHWGDAEECLLWISCQGSGMNGGNLACIKGENLRLLWKCLREDLTFPVKFILGMESIAEMWPLSRVAFVILYFL